LTVGDAKGQPLSDKRAKLQQFSELSKLLVLVFKDLGP